MRRILWFILLFFPFADAGFATVFGTVRGIVHDPQHRPVPNVTVTLKAQASSYIQTSETDANGEFHFDGVPLGEYRVTASAASFANAEQTIAVLSGTAPILHFELKLSTQAESITVSADAGPAQLESITPTTLVNLLEIRETPGPSPTNTLPLITGTVLIAFSPSSRALDSSVTTNPSLFSPPQISIGPTTSSTSAGTPIA